MEFNLLKCLIMSACNYAMRRILNSKPTPTPCDIIEHNRDLSGISYSKNQHPAGKSRRGFPLFRRSRQDSGFFPVHQSIGL
jgi:hypothetical protein